jgi:hypothetical protein
MDTLAFPVLLHGNQQDGRCFYWVSQVLYMEKIRHDRDHLVQCRQRVARHQFSARSELWKAEASI